MVSRTFEYSRVLTCRVQYEYYSFAENYARVVSSRVFFVESSIEYFDTRYSTTFGGAGNVIVLCIYCICIPLQVG